LDPSLLIAVLNERENLTALLSRLTRLLDRLGCQHEIIVIDAGSRDGTPEFAREHGVRVLDQQGPC
jgi:glycosyltransferase involved in cell wall biosynthesis